MKYLIKLFLISFILILTYKAHANDFNLDACKEALLVDKTGFLYQAFEAIEQDNLDHLLKDQDYLKKAYEELHNNGNDLLYYASLLGKPNSIEVIVSKLNIDVNTEDSNKRTAMHYAALNEDILSRLDTIYILVKLGIDPETTDNLDRLPSFYIKERESKKRYHPKERRLKGAELALPPYHINRSYLLKLFQIEASTLDSWVKDKAIELLKQGIPTSEVSIRTLLPEYKVMNLSHPKRRGKRGRRDLTHVYHNQQHIENAVRRVLEEKEPIEEVAKDYPFLTEDRLRAEVTQARFR